MWEEIQVTTECKLHIGSQGLTTLSCHFILLFMMSVSASPPSAVQSKLMKDEYQNWLAVGHAFCLMNEGIRPYITREMQTLYNTLLGLPNCVCIHDNTRKKNPWHDMATCAWAKALQGLHHANKPKWSQSDSSKWADPTLGCWEIAKLFMSDLGKHTTAVVDAQSTDVTGLMNILCWCKHFNTLRTYAEQVRNNRNTKWGHVPNLEISLADKNCVIESITNLLNASVLTKDDDAQNALQEVKDIDIHFDAQELERKILLDFVSETETVLDDVMMRLSQCEGRSSRDRKEMEGLEKRLACYEKILITLNQRIQDMETFWLYPLWLKAVNVFLGLRKCSTTCLMVLILFVAVVQLDPNTYDDRCPSEDRPLLFDIKEFNFSRQLNSARKGFVGRKWLFEDVKSKLNNSDTSTVLIVGDPGSGKSAIAAHLICSRNSDLSINQHIIAYHLCQHYNKETQEPGRFIRNIVDMIARRLSDYENIILNNSLTERLRRHDCEGYPHECFEEGIILPLKDVLKTNQPDTHDDNLYYIVIDALDECIPAQGGPVTTIVDLIKDKAPRFPKNIKLVATTRNDSSFIAELKTFAEIVVIDPSDRRNEEDIAFFIDSAPNRRLNFIDKIIEYFHLRSEEIRMKESQYLVRMGQGNFLFVKLLAQYRQFDPDYTTTPKTIGQVYEGYFRRSYPTTESFSRSIRGVLEILVSSLQPLKKEDIFYILSLQNSNLVYNYFLQDLKSLSHFIRYGENSTASLFHKSLAEWLTSEENQGRFFIQKEEGHKKLIPYYIDLIKSNTIDSIDISKHILAFAQHLASGNVYHQYDEVFHNLSSVIIKRSLADDNPLSHLAATINNTIVIKLFLPYFQNDLDCVDSRGFTPAFISASRGYLNNVRFLVNYGANVNHKTNPPPPLPFRSFEDPVVICKREFWGSTMLHAAAQLGYFDIVKFLVKNKATISDKNGVSMTALQLAAENGHLKIVQLLYNHGAMVDQLALHHAAMNGHKHVVEFLLSKGITDDCMRCDGSFYWLEGNHRYQSLWIDIGLEHTESSLSTREADFGILKQVKAEKDVDYILFDDHSLLYCETALHVAVAKSHVDVVTVLLSRNDSSFTCTDFTGRTPLHIAASKNSLKIIKLLLESGARTGPKCSFIQQIRLTNIKDSMYYIKKHKHLSLKEESDYFTDVCSCDHTPIDAAAAFGHVESVELLLQYNGSLATKRDCNGASIIHIAACNGHHHFVRWIIHYIRDVDINSPSKNGSTPLHSAAYCGKYELVKHFISYGASIQTLDDKNMTALHYTALSPVTDQDLPDMVCFEEDYSNNKEAFFSNEHVTACETRNAIGVLNGYTVKFRFSLPNYCVFRQLVNFDDNCFAFQELLQSSSDVLSKLNVKDSTGKTVLELAVINKRHCITIWILKHIKNIEQIRAMIHQLSYDLIGGDADLSLLLLLPILDRYRLFQNAVTNLRPDWMYFLHERQMKFSKDFLKKSVLTYLQSNKRSRAIESLFLDLEVGVDIECQKPFLESHLHLLAFWSPSDDLDNFFYTKESNKLRCFDVEGPLTTAVMKHPLGKDILNQCRDIEGYTPLHRAAQGGNIVGIKHFLQLGADATATADNWNQTALELAVSYAGFPYSYTAESVDTAIASKVSILLLYETPNLKIICDGSATQLTIYHIASYRGMIRFVKELLDNSKRFGLSIDCPDVNGITPLYLAKLNIGTNVLINGKERDPWLEIAKLIERSYGGKLTFPHSLEAEHHVLFKHLYGSMDFDAFIKSQQDLFKEMELLYSDETTMQKCLRENENMETELKSAAESLFRNFNFTNISALRDKNDTFTNVLKLKITVAQSDLLKRNQNILKKYDISSITSKNISKHEKINEMLSIEEQIMQVQAIKKNRVLMEASTARQEHVMEILFNLDKDIHRSFALYTKKVQDILDYHSTFFEEKVTYILKLLKYHLRKYKQQNFCTKLTKWVRHFLLFLSIHISSACVKDSRLSCLQSDRENLVNDRLSLTAIPEGNYSERDFKILVHGIRYLLDIMMHKETKYDYLRMLTLGIASRTRLFYNKEHEEDKLERALIRQNIFVEQTRSAVKKCREFVKAKQDGSSKITIQDCLLSSQYKRFHLCDLCDK